MVAHACDPSKVLQRLRWDRRIIHCKPTGLQNPNSKQKKAKQNRTGICAQLLVTQTYNPRRPSGLSFVPFLSGPNLLWLGRTFRWSLLSAPSFPPPPFPCLFSTGPLYIWLVLSNHENSPLWPKRNISFSFSSVS